MSPPSEGQALRSGQRSWYKEERRVKSGGVEKDNASPTRGEAEDMSHQGKISMALYALSCKDILSGLLDGLAVSHVFKVSQSTLPLNAGEGLGMSAC